MWDELAKCYEWKKIVAPTFVTTKISSRLTTPSAIFARIPSPTCFSLPYKWAVSKCLYPKSIASFTACIPTSSRAYLSFNNQKFSFSHFLMTCKNITRFVHSLYTYKHRSHPICRHFEAIIQFNRSDNHCTITNFYKCNLISTIMPTQSFQCNNVLWNDIPIKFVSSVSKSSSLKLC